MKRALFIPLFIALTSCATHLTQSQCMSTNWQNEGFNDGVNGKTPRDLTQAIADCGQFNLTVNSNGYQAGWRKGAKEYCTPGPDVGYSDAVAGKSENSIYDREPICTMAGTKLNVSGYQQGRKKGLPVFCTYENGYNLARQGKNIPANVCPSSSKDFTMGWTNGREELCRSGRNAFALGKEGKPYPEVCSPDIFASFKMEYDRGGLLNSHGSGIQSEINDINYKIGKKVWKYDLKEDHGFYRLGKNNSAKAQAELDEVNKLVRKKQGLERELFKLQIMR